MNKQKLVNQLKNELLLQKANRTQKERALNEQDIYELIAYTEHFFTKNIGKIPNLVRGANEFALVYVSVDNSVRIQHMKTAFLILAPTIGGVSLVFVLLGGFGLGAGVLASWWAFIFGGWIPIANVILLGVAVTATASAITYALTQMTPQKMGIKAFESIIEGLDKWTKSDEQLKDDDKKTKSSMNNAA